MSEVEPAIAELMDWMRDDDIYLMCKIVMNANGCTSLSQLHAADSEQFFILYEEVWSMMQQLDEP